MKKYRLLKDTIGKDEVIPKGLLLKKDGKSGFYTNEEFCLLRSDKYYWRNEFVESNREWFEEINVLNVVALDFPESLGMCIQIHFNRKINANESNEIIKLVEEYCKSKNV